MAQQWQVPPDTSAKEKIVGGVLTFNQLIWMILGLGIAAGLSLFLGTLLGMGIVGLIIGLIVGIGFGCFFCFYKKNDIPIFTYMCLKRNHAKKVHHLPHHQRDKFLNGGV